MCLQKINSQLAKWQGYNQEYLLCLRLYLLFFALSQWLLMPGIECL